MNADEITKWLNKMHIVDYKINNDLTVDVDGDLDLYGRGGRGVLESIPIQFGKVSGHCEFAFNKLSSLKGCPHYVGGNFTCFSNHLTSLEYCPQIVKGSFLMTGNNIHSLHNIHKHIKQIGDDLQCSEIRSHILGVFFIKGLRFVDFSFTRGEKEMKMEKIVNGHLKGDRDVHACQEELIKAGFAEYAKL